jgi:hypothetical protein
MNKDARIEKISLLKRQAEEDANSLRVEIPWKDELEVMTVCKIPLRYLIYNSLNGRILTRTQSLQTQKKKIQAENEEDNKLIEDLLWNSSKKENENTLLDIHNLGQQKIGIITKDGIVVDGNRRLMLLNELKTKRHTSKSKKLTKDYDYFKAVVLPVTKDENLEEIEKLEITYQLGEDKKVDYATINLYLKIQRQYKSLTNESYPTRIELQNNTKTINEMAIKKIYDLIGNYKTIETKKDVKFILSVMNIMDEYLEYFGYEGIPLALDNREEQFRGLASWLDNFQGEGSKKAFDKYKEKDVDLLKIVCFDLIRFKLQNTEFRKIGQGQKDSHFFGNKDIWHKFNKSHLDIISRVSEVDINYDAQDLESHIQDRDNKFIKSIKEDVKINISDCYSILNNKKNHDEPEKLINKAKEALKEVSIKAGSFSKPDTQRQLKEVSDRVTELLLKNDTSLVLEQSLNLIKKIDMDILNNEDSDKRLDLVKQINSLTFEMKKKLGG